MKTDDLIVELARSAGPVQALPPPSMRLWRWARATLPLMLLAVFIIGPRKDVAAVIGDATFLGIAAVTLATALLAAASAFVLSIPGAERSRVQRTLPLIAGGVWTFVLAYSLAMEGAAIDRLLQWPVHAACIIEIAFLGFFPGAALFGMLREAAPLERAWTGALAALAGVAFAAAATQFICPIDDQAHQLVGHVLPVAVLSMLGVIAGQRYLNWWHR